MKKKYLVLSTMDKILAKVLTVTKNLFIPKVPNHSGKIPILSEDGTLESSDSTLKDIDDKFNDYIPTVPNSVKKLPEFTSDGTINSSGFTVNDFWNKFEMKQLNQIEAAVNPSDHIYVTTTGNDISGNGSQAFPFKSVGKAIEVGSLYTGDSYVRINIADGNYYEKGWNIRNPNYMGLYGSGSDKCKIYFTGLHNPAHSTPCNMIFVNKYIIISNITFIADYILPYDFFTIAGGKAIFNRCSFISDISQPNNSIAISATNGSSVVIEGFDNNQISGFKRGICLYNASHAYASISGEVSDIAYGAHNGSWLMINTNRIPIYGKLEEQYGGRIELHHTRSTNRGLQIYVSPTGDDRNYGFNKTLSPVKTIQRAVEIANMISGTGTILIDIANGTYDIYDELYLYGISRMIFFSGESRSGTIIRINTANKHALHVRSCGGIQISNLTIRRVGQGTTHTLYIVRTGFLVSLSTIDATVKQNQYGGSNGLAIASSVGLVNESSISNFDIAVLVTDGASIATTVMSGDNNRVGYWSIRGSVAISGTRMNADIPEYRDYGSITSITIKPNWGVGTFTNGATSNDSGLLFCNISGIVHVRCTCTANTLSAVNIATLPQYFRPKYNVPFVAGIFGDNPSGASGRSGYISSGGVIVLRATQTPLTAATILGFHITYPADS